jgi:S1-C subfamily serine protease
MFSSKSEDIKYASALIDFALPSKLATPVMQRLQAKSGGKTREIWTGAIEQTKDRTLGQLLGLWKGQYVRVPAGTVVGMDLKFEGPTGAPTVKYLQYEVNRWTSPAVPVKLVDGDIIFEVKSDRLEPDQFVMQLDDMGRRLTGEVDEGTRRVGYVSFAK